jgi:RNA polymerase sigma factor (sigma-70 family)
MKNTYTLNVYNTITRKYEKVQVSLAVYNAYRRSDWNIKDNDKSFFEHEIQMSGLIGGEDGSFENFKEFINCDDTPEKIFEHKTTIAQLRKYLSLLSKSEMELINAIFYKGLSEREYMRISGISQTTISYRKKEILKKLKNNL